MLEGVGGVGGASVLVLATPLTYTMLLGLAICLLCVSDTFLGKWL